MLYVKVKGLVLSHDSLTHGHLSVIRTCLWLMLPPPYAAYGAWRLAIEILREDWPWDENEKTSPLSLRERKIVLHPIFHDLASRGLTQ